MNKTLVFFEDTSCDQMIQKYPRQKLYLPRQKWTINKTLIFLRIRDVIENNDKWNCIYQDWKKQ